LLLSNTELTEDRLKQIIRSDLTGLPDLWQVISPRRWGVASWKKFTG